MALWEIVYCRWWMGLFGCGLGVEGGGLGGDGVPVVGGEVVAIFY